MVNLILIKTMLFLFPGIIGIKVYNLITCKKTKYNYEELINTIIFSFAVIVSYDVLIQNVPLFKSSFELEKAINSIINTDEIELNLKQMSVMLGIAFFYAYVYAFITELNIFNKIAYKLKINKISSNSDLWDVFHKNNTPWVVIRDFKNEQIHFGYVEYYGAGDKDNLELLLIDVKSTNDKNEFERYSDSLYLLLEKGTFTMEMPNYGKGNVNESVTEPNKVETKTTTTSITTTTTTTTTQNNSVY